MEKMKQLIVGEEGQSLVEYGLILGLVSVALVTVLGTMKDQLNGIFKTIADSLKKAAAAAKSGG